MPRIIIADTSCLIILNKINHLHLLRDVFGEVVITSIISKELSIILPNWIIIRNPQNTRYQEILNASVDIGEASAIALAIEIQESLVILDDLKARKVAKKLNLSITGTLGIILLAKLQGKIDSIEFLLDEIKKTNFHISDTLEKSVLDKAKKL